ncbi:MAG: HD-GYP domain-containing protein [Aridibacter sp.]
MAVADAFDAMVSDRIYRRGRSFEEATKELEKYAGTQFDPEIVRAFKNIPQEDWETLRTRSLNDKQKNFSFQAIVEQLIRKDQHFEMVH